MAKGKVTKIFDIRSQVVTDPKTKKEVTKAKVQFAKGITIFFNGEEVDLGEYNSGFIKRKDEVLADLEYAVENFGLKQDFADSQAEFMEEKKITSVFEVYNKN